MSLALLPDVYSFKMCADGRFGNFEVGFLQCISQDVGNLVGGIFFLDLIRSGNDRRIDLDDLYSGQRFRGLSLCNLNHECQANSDYQQLHNDRAHFHSSVIATSLYKTPCLARRLVVWWISYQESPPPLGGHTAKARRSMTTCPM